MSKISLAALFSSAAVRFAAAGTTVLVVLVIAVLVFQPYFGVKVAYAADEFTLTPETSDALGVDPSTVFNLESRDPMSKSDIEKLLVIQTKNDTAYDLTQVSDKQIKITFAKPLTPDDIVKVSIPTTSAWPNGETATRNYNWAFQVKGDFHVVSTIPGDQTAQVPVDSGIEFNFNYENIDPAAFQSALTIAPAVKGHVEVSRRTFVFVPEEHLQSSTLYTVTLSGSLPLIGSQETLGEDQTFTFETEIDQSNQYAFSIDHYQTITPTQSVALTYSEWGTMTNQATPFHVKLFRFGSFEDYHAAVEKAQGLEWRTFVSADSLIDVSGTPDAEFDAETQTLDYRQLITFPMNLSEGYYVADISKNGAESWALIQSSPLTAYIARATDRTLVWVNDATSGAAVVGAAVQYVGDGDGATTGGDGIAYLPSKDSQSDELVVSSQGSNLLIQLRGYLIYDGKGSYSWAPRYPNDGVAEGFWTYLYTDRPTYKPTDTMKFWGYVENRDNGKRPTTVHVDVGFDQTDVAVDQNGMFTGQFALQNVPPASYQLVVSWDGQTVSQRGISVSEYVKPAYTITLTPDVDAAFVGDTIGYTVNAAYFEGTPVKGLEVAVSGECVNQTLTLDDAGNARGSFSCDYRARSGRYPNWTWLSASPINPEEGNIRSDVNVILFGPKVYLDTDWQKDVIVNGNATVDLTVRNTQAINSTDPAVFGPTTRAGQTIDGTITEVTYTQTEIGTAYDFISKKTYKQYSYERHENQIGTFQATSGADGKAAYTFPAPNPLANYFVDLKTTDELGRTDETRIDLWQRQDFELYQTSNALSFHNDDAAPTQDQWSFPGYGVGEQVHLSIQQNGRQFAPPTNGRFLYFQAQRGIQEVTTSTSATYAFPYEQRDVPNLSVYGVLFADGAYQQVGQGGWWFGGSGFPVQYDNTRSELTITVTADQDSYRPGSDVSLAVHVTDKGGNPVAADVNLNLVDEAYYALFPETVNPLGELYRWVDDGVILTQATENTYEPVAEGAEKGGGGDRALGRSLFKDNAAFDVVHTDGSGNGTLTMTLPDNITQWRVTAQGVNADRKLAGRSITDINATLPFFISPVMRESYLDDDQPTALIRVAGTQIGLGDSVEYDVQIPDASFEQKTTKTAAETLAVDLPDLALGPHNVTITATDGQLTDKMTRVVNIVPSRLQKPVVSSVMLTTAGGTVTGATDRYTNVTFVDGGTGQYYGELEALSWTWGDRADEALTRVYATQLLNESFGEDLPLPDLTVSAFATNGSGIRLLPYADTDFDLSAKVALLGNVEVNNNEASYFYEKLDDKDHPLSPRETAEAFAALATLGEPVLAEFQRQAPALGTDPDVRLWVALGLHGAGDDEGARAIYRDLVSTNATQKDGYIYLEDKNPATSLERTALLAILSGALNEPQRDQIHDYVVSQRSPVIETALDRLVYVRETLPNLIAAPGTLTYTLGGEQKSATLEKGQSVSLLLSPDALAGLHPTVTGGQVLAISRYNTALVDPNEPVDASLGLTRSYSTAYGSAATTFASGDLIKVTIKYTVPDDGCDREQSNIPCTSYELTDVLPSGLAVVTPTYGTGCSDYPSDVSDQRVSFNVWSHSYASCTATDTITYYARVVTPGTYEAEPAYIRSTRDPNDHNHSDSAAITITP